MSPHFNRSIIFTVIGIVFVTYLFNGNADCTPMKLKKQLISSQLQFAVNGLRNRPV